MSDLVFSCPACDRPLAVKEALTGNRIVCPLCDTEIEVPRVKTAVLISRESGKRSENASERRSAKILEALYDVQKAADSLIRKAKELEQQLALIEGGVAVSRERLTVFERHLEPMHFKQSPSESIQIPESWTPAPKQGQWKALSIGFGTLAFLLALGLALGLMSPFG